MRYAVVIEQGERNYSAYVPDLPACVSVGGTLDEVQAEVRDAIDFHLEGMREDGFPIPKPSSGQSMSRLGSKPRKQIVASRARRRKRVAFDPDVAGSKTPPEPARP